MEDLSLVLNAHPLCTDLEGLNGPQGLLHGLLGAEDAQIEAHGLAEVIPYLPGPLGAGINQQGLQSLFFYFEDFFGNWLQVTVADRLRGSRAGPASEDNGFEEGIPSQAIGSVHTHARAFACGEESQ